MIAPIRLSKKCKYALRAIFELALRGTTVPVKIHSIASAQDIPPRFLEIILAELKHGGFVESRRGSEGGYILARSARNLTVGEVLEFLRKGSSFSDRLESSNIDRFGDYAFSEMLKKVNISISNIYDHTTFADLVDRELLIRNVYVANYAI